MPPRISFPLSLFIVAMLSSIAVTSCGVDCKDPKNAGSATCIAEGAVVSCVGGDVTQAVIDHGPEVRDAILAGVDKQDGSIHYDAIESNLIGLAVKYGSCVVAKIFQDFIVSKLATAVPGEYRAPTPAAAKDAFEKFRAKQAPGKKFEVSPGVVL